MAEKLVVVVVAVYGQLTTGPIAWAAYLQAWRVIQVVSCDWRASADELQIRKEMKMKQRAHTGAPMLLECKVIPVY